jgi:hypothetical protein
MPSHFYIYKHEYKKSNVIECEYQNTKSSESENTSFFAESERRDRKPEKTRVLRGCKSPTTPDFIGIWA